MTQTNFKKQIIIAFQTTKPGDSITLKCFTKAKPIKL